MHTLRALGTHRRIIESDAICDANHTLVWQHTLESRAQALRQHNSPRCSPDRGPNQTPHEGRLLRV
jgi:hypothetical protein